MNPRTAIALFMLVAASAAADSVTVCMGDPAPEIAASRILASQMFDTIDVQIHWVKYQRCPPEAIRVTIQMYSDEITRPGALAYAFPFERTNLVVFHDRILRFDPDLQTTLLAHVLVHEITHMLQGTGHHSEAGVMKAA